MKSPMAALFAPFLLITMIVLVLTVAVVDAGGHTTPGGTILDVGDCRSRYCPREILGTDATTTTTATTARPRPRPLRTVEELFGFGGGRNYDDYDDAKVSVYLFIYFLFLSFVLVLVSGKWKKVKERE